MTALQAVRDHGRMRPVQQVLVLGASGGVGSFAVQIAKAFGATVTGVCSTGKLDHLTALGVDHVIDYTTTDFAVGRQRFDVILDIGGNSALARLRRVLIPGGVLVIIGGETDGRLLGGSGRTLGALVVSPFVSQKLGSFVASENAADFEILAGLLESGRVTPSIDRTYPLADVPAAITHVVEGPGTRQDRRCPLNARSGPAMGDHARPTPQNQRRVPRHYLKESTCWYA